MKSRLVLFALLASGCASASASRWVQLDKLGGPSYLVRQGDRASLRRTGPWAEFTQRWLAYPRGVLSKETPVHELMAVNCLTGARAARRYESTDLDTEERTLITSSFTDIEQNSSPIGRIDIVKPEQGLDANMLDFACGCQAPKPVEPTDERALLKVYDTFVKEQTKEVGYHLRFMQFATKRAAMSALKRVEAGSSFTSVAARLDTQPEFPGGDLGLHPAHAWPGPTAQIFSKMKPGDYTKEPINGINGYSIYLMESRYEKPAAPFDDWKAAIEAYANLEQSCGRKLF